MINTLSTFPLVSPRVPSLLGAICAVTVLTTAWWSARADETQNDDPAKAQWERQLSQLNDLVADEPDRLALYSQRGDVLFFLGRFEAAVADYDKMIAIDASRAASHWRRGIALFYAERAKEAAAQFEQYHSFDDVDRENGIWRYFSQWKASGKEAAQAELLRYEKDDREPFPDLYAFFAGKLSGEEVLTHIKNAELTSQERRKREFYAHLYLGLERALAQDNEAARLFLTRAVENDWPRQAGYGPHYMWQVGRLHLEQLANE